VEVQPTEGLQPSIRHLFPVIQLLEISSKKSQYLGYIFYLYMDKFQCLDHRYYLYNGSFGYIELQYFGSYQQHKSLQYISFHHHSSLGYFDIQLQQHIRRLYKGHYRYKYWQQKCFCNVSLLTIYTLVTIHLSCHSHRSYKHHFPYNSYQL
jgi:hypothetical protein